MTDTGTTEEQTQHEAAAAATTTNQNREGEGECAPDRRPLLPLVWCFPRGGYSYVVLAAASVGLVFTAPGQASGFTHLVEIFIKDLHISRSILALEYSIATFLSGVAMTFLGRLVDLWGARRSAMVGVVLLGLTSVWTGLVWEGVGLELAFLLQRLLGQGFVSVCCTKMLSMWWVERRGMAMGVATATMSLGAVFGYNTLMDYLIRSLGWRWALYILGAMEFVFMLPVVVLFFVDSPESCGLLPDGRAVPAAGRAPEDVEEGSGKAEELLTPEQRAELRDEPYQWTAGEAAGTAVFWTLSLGLACEAYAITALFLNLQKLFEDSGMGASRYMTIMFFVTCAVSASISLAGGAVMDWVEPRLVIAGGLMSGAVAFEAAAFFGPIGNRYVGCILFAVSLGVVTGTLITTLMTAYGTYYGNKHLGSINGAGTAMLLIGSSLGPVVLGTYRQYHGDYALVLHISAGASLVLAVSNLLSRRPTPPAGTGS